MLRLSVLPRLSLVAIVAVVAIGPVAHADAAVPGRYIVVLKRTAAEPDAAAQDLAARLGFQLDHVYRAAIKGFAAQLTKAAVDRLRRDPRVASVEEDREVKLHIDREPTGPDMLSTVPTSETRHAKPSGLDRYSGTSMAAPHASAAIALNIKQGRGATYGEERGVLPDGVLKVGDAIQCGD